MKKFSRRQTCKGMGALALAASAKLGGACGDIALPPLPQNLPAPPNADGSGPAATFSHGVASGDPTASAVIIWTRVSPTTADEEVSVFYEVALDSEFVERVAAGTLVTDADRDFTVKVDVENLIWGRDYYYRFHALGKISQVGRTRLAPAAGDKTKTLNFGVCSCSSYAHGYFHGYRWLAARQDLDAVIHVGDYIYEYGTGEYGEVREYEPNHEIVTLADYRQRYQQYRRDSDLQAIHARHPMIVIWDDHETADNSYKDGAENHQPDSEGDWQERKYAARQAYLEWLPIRETAATAKGKLYRRLAYGDLAEVIVLDTRIAGRDEMLTGLDQETNERSILGQEQEEWLGQQLNAATGRWKILAQQVVVAQTLLGGTPYNIFFDDWNGYPSAQQRLFDQLAPLKGQTIILTGDVHSSWANEIARDPQATDYDRAVDNFAIELVAPAITSPGAPLSPEVMMEQNPNVRWVDFKYPGYLVLNLNANAMQAQWFHYRGPEADEGEEFLAAAFSAGYGSAVLNKVASDD